MADPPRRGRRRASGRRRRARRPRCRSGSARRPRAPPSCRPRSAISARASAPSSPRTTRRARWRGSSASAASAASPPRRSCGYLGAAQLALGVLPTQRGRGLRALLRRGGRDAARRSTRRSGAGSIARLGLALRKRFCRRFDFELQAAASDDAVVLSLGPGQSLPARGRAALPDAADGAGDARPGAAALADVPGAVALEPRPRARGPAPARRPPQSAAHPAHGGRRPDGRGVPRAGRLPGERRRGADRDPRSPDGAADDVRLPPRGDRRGRARGRCSKRSRRAGCGLTSSTPPSPRRCPTRS